jgi:phosphonate transport system ATP-binding protein
MADPVLRLRDLRVRYGDKPPVLDVLALDVAAGEIVCLIGPSGAGKTTLLRLANGYVDGECGELEVLGRAVRFGPGGDANRRDRALRRRVGFVLQSFNVIERASVFDNVLWGSLGRQDGIGTLLGRFPEADRQLAMDAIAEVDLVAQASQRADTLSGGQQQRVGVARVIVQKPDLVLADEPVSSLDPVLAAEIIELMVEVARRHGNTLVMSVHLPALAQRFADRVVGLREGKVVWDGAAAALDEAAIAAIYGAEAPPPPPPVPEATP